jgi:glutathionyl-hydroquinone reductase
MLILNISFSDSIFLLNRQCVKLRIINVKLRCDLFNMLVRFTASYACEVWVNSKKIEDIEIMYQEFFKSLLRMRKTTSTLNLANSPLNMLHGDKCCYTIIV